MNRSVSDSSPPAEGGGFPVTIVTAAAALCVASSLLWPHGMMAASVVLMVFGSWCLMSRRWCWGPEDNPAAWINLTFAVYALGSSAISWFHGDPVANLEQYLPFLGAGLLAVGFRMAAPRPFLIGAAFAAAAILAGSASIVQVLGAEEMHRANFLAFSTWFGTMGALCAVICAGFLGWPEAAEGSPARKAILAAGVAGGIAVALLSGSKGAWLQLLAAGPFAVLWIMRRATAKGALIGLLVIFSGIIAAALLPHSPIVPRIKEALHEGDRLRLAYWHDAWEMAEEHSLLGGGRAALKERLNATSLEVRSGIPLGQPPNDAHNEYLDVFAARGGAGLLLILAAYVVPLAVLLHLMFHCPGSRGPAAIGLLFIIAFAAGGLTGVQFAVNSLRMMFLFVVLFCVTAATSKPCTAP
ncbi:MAG: O-antigen ligase family protein [Chthoniobacterales bacterium]|nr:O-antigen ligase family protein [Chthoniobacterales bacterium]